jgi:hypothetical protein
MDDETPRRGVVGRAREAIEFRLWHLTGTLYVAAGSLIGFEALVALFGYLTIWPVGIPAMILAVGVYALIRSRWRERRTVGSQA